MMFSQRFQCTRYLFLGSYLNFDSHSFRLSNYFQGLPWLTQLVKNLWATQETQVQFLSQEDFPGEGNGNPLQYSCLENSMDRGA